FLLAAVTEVEVEAVRSACRREVLAARWAVRAVAGRRRRARVVRLLRLVDDRLRHAEHDRPTRRRVGREANLEAVLHFLRRHADDRAAVADDVLLNARGA